MNGEPTSGSDFVHGGCHAAARQVSETVQFNSRIDQFVNGFPKGGCVADDRALEFEAFANGEDGDAVGTDIAAENHGVTGTHFMGRDFDMGVDLPDAGGGDEDTVALAALDYFGVAGDDLYTGALRPAAHVGGDS